ncbi:MAG: hypothetical protein NXI30_09640 [bacterium]|nr:hypothetical protein [bacterium]
MRAEGKRVAATLLLTTAMLFAASAQAIEVSIEDLSVSGGSVQGDLVLLPVGETVTVDIRLGDPTASVWSGFGISYYGYDGARLGFVGGQAVSQIFSNFCFFAGPPPTCADDLPNYAGSALPGPNRTLVEDTVFPGVPLVGEPRVRAFFVWQHVSTVVGTDGGPDDFGLDGVLGGGDAHASVTFEGLSDGITEITIGTGDDLGGVILGQFGVPVSEGATNARIRLAVPEPGVASALTVGVLASLAGLRRRQLPE